MTEHCAVCGAEDVWKRVSLPNDWERYLRTERGLDATDGYYLLPTCQQCGDEVSMQKEMDDLLETMDDDTRVLLDDLEVDALVEERGE